MRHQLLALALVGLMVLSGMAFLAEDAAATTGTTVGTTTGYPFPFTDDNPSLGPFYTSGSGRYWLFWNDGTNLVYSSATDLAGSWANKATAVSSGNVNSVAECDGTYIHLAYLSANTIYYKRCTLATDGTMTFGTVRTVTTTSKGNRVPGMCISSDSHVCIGWIDGTSGNPVIDRNSGATSVDTWVDATGFPVTVGTDGPWFELRAGLVGSIFIESNGGAKVHFNNISSAGVIAGQEDASLASCSYIYDFTAYNGVVYMVYKDTSNHIQYRSRSAAGTWDVSETTLLTLATCCPCITYDPVAGDLYVIWQNTASNLVVYDKYHSSSWGGATTWYDESTDGGILQYSGSLPYITQNSCLAYAYRTCTGSPYNVKAGKLQLTIAPVAAFSGTPLTGHPGMSVTFTDASTNTPTNWTWWFGDGIKGYTQNPSHTYNLAGKFTVILIATNSAGSSNCTKSNYVTVTAWKPTLTSAAPGTTGTNHTVYSYHPTWNESVSVTWDIIPGWASYAGGILSGTPTAINTVYEFEMEANSTVGKRSLFTFWNVTTQNHAIVSGSPSLVVAEHGYYTFTATHDQTGNWTWSTNATWLNRTLGNVYGTPLNPESGKYYYVSLRFVNLNGIGYLNWSINVTETAPYFTSTPLTTGYLGAVYYYQATTADDPYVTYQVTSSAPFITYSATTGQVSSQVSNVSSFTMSIRAYDGHLYTWQNYTVFIIGSSGQQQITQVLIPVIYLALSLFFTALFYRDPHMGIVAGFCWFVGGLVVLLPISFVLFLITLIPAMYYIWSGVSD